MFSLSDLGKNSQKFLVGGFYIVGEYLEDLQKELFDLNKKLNGSNNFIITAILSSLKNASTRAFLDVSKVLLEENDTFAENIINTYFGSLANVREEKTEKEEKLGMYPYIPFGRSLFVNTLRGILKAEKIPASKFNFIDVGSGIGDKVLLAHLLGFNSSGVEFTESTFNASKLLLIDNMNYHDCEVNLYNENALTFDFGEYNFIYLYHPIHKPAMMMKLYKQIFETMPENGIVVEVLVNSDTRESYLRFNGEEVNDETLYRTIYYRENSGTYFKKIKGKLVIKEFKHEPYSRREF